MTVPLPAARPLRRASALLLAATLAACAHAPAGHVPAAPADPRLARIQNVVVIYAENRSFDHLYGLFPGANGIANATPAQYTQIDHDGKPLPSLVLMDHGKPDPKFAPLPNRPFRIDAPPINRQPGDMVPSPTHLFYHHKEQINGGANNMFAAMSAVGGWVMGHYDGSGLKLWQWAREYTLADNFFQGAFGGSYLNHQYLICACAPRHDKAPANMRIKLDDQGRLGKEPDSPSAMQGGVKVVSRTWAAQVSPDGWSVNTAQPPYQPSLIEPPAGGPATLARPGPWQAANAEAEALPPQTARTVGDTLSARGIHWAWYAGGWNQAVADGTQPPGQARKVIYNRSEGSPNFQSHHQPFNYYSRFAPGSADRATHLRDGEDLLQAIDSGTLPAVSFYKPAGVYTQHPSYTDVAKGDAHIAGILERLRASPQWPGMLVIVTYDENGGFWDHVPPPTGAGRGDALGPGSRIPALLIGPMVKRGFIDSTHYDTGSIIKLLTDRFGLEPLPGVRAQIGNLTHALQP